MITDLLLAINLFVFLLFAYDKRCARRHQWRVPEKVLLLACALGGAVGGYLAMQLCRHKTRKWKFRLTVPLLILLQIAAMVMYEG